MPEHKDIIDPNIHETKGASTALTGQVLTATGLGTATFQTPAAYSNVKVGSYRIVNSSGTPVALTVAGTYYTLTNDSLGAGTSSTFGVAGVSDIWTEGSNQFAFTGFTLGDELVIHVDADIVTTSANVDVDIEIEFGIGGSIYSIPLITKKPIKTASTTRITEQKFIVLRDSNTLNYPARIKAKADATGVTVKVNEFYVGVFTRS